MISQDFKIHVDFENYVILGNDALLKCDIPSFVADLVDVFGWFDNEGNEYLANALHYGDYRSQILFVLIYRSGFFKWWNKSLHKVTNSRNKDRFLDGGNIWHPKDHVDIKKTQ